MAVHLNQQECFKKYTDMWISAHLKLSLDDQNKLPDLKKTLLQGSPRRNATLNLKMWFRNKHTFNNPVSSSSFFFF